MKRISMRSWAIWLLILLLLGGLAFFITEFFFQAENWVMQNGSPHIYETGGTSPAKGTVVDRNGQLLLSYGQGRTYSANAAVRQATIHWLGDRQGNIHAPMISHYTKELSGYNVVTGTYQYGNQGGKAVLTLSASIQQAALEAMGEEKGILAVYNYKTGEILCAVSTPAFDPDDVPDIAGDTTGKYEGAYVNRFTRSLYTPGSIFKIATTAAALENLPDIQQWTYTCTGTYQFGIDKVTCQKAHGTVNLQSAMAYSCNCAYAQIALLLGQEGLQQAVDRYALLESIAFDGITTAQGSILLEDQAEVQLAWSAIGQHKDLINPAAFLSFVGAIANGGQGVAPYMVSQIQAGGKPTYSAQATATQRIMDPETAETLAQFMRNNVVQNYKAEHFHGMTVCAKSGTAQVDANSTTNALFTGFVSDEQYPIAFLVIVEGGSSGGRTCLPILSKVLAACKAELDGN